MMDIDWPDEANECQVVPNTEVCAQDDQPISFKKRRPVKSKRKIYAQPLIIEIQVDLEDEETKRKRRKKQKKQDLERAHGVFCWWYLICLSLISLANDGEELYKEFGHSDCIVSGRTALGGLDFYSAMVAIDVIAMAAAWDQYMYLAVGCRVVGYFMLTIFNNSQQSSEKLRRQGLDERNNDCNEIEDSSF